MVAQNHKPRKLGIVQSLTDTVSHVIKYLHNIVCMKKEVKIPRIDLFERTKVNICRSDYAVFLYKSSAQAAFIVLQIGGSNNNVTSFNNVVGIKALR